MRAGKWAWIGLVIAICLASQAQVTAGEGAALDDRVGQLEREIAALKNGSGVDNAKKNGLWSSLDIQFYGYIKADASYDDSRTTPGNFIVWVNSETTNKNDDEFNLTANQTRMGFNITGPAGMQASFVYKF